MLRVCKTRSHARWIRIFCTFSNWRSSDLCCRDPLTNLDKCGAHFFNLLKIQASHLPPAEMAVGFLGLLSWAGHGIGCFLKYWMWLLFFLFFFLTILFVSWLKLLFFFFLIFLFFFLFNSFILCVFFPLVCWFRLSFLCNCFQVFHISIYMYIFLTLCYVLFWKTPIKFLKNKTKNTFITWEWSWSKVSGSSWSTEGF